ncbi:hypothetical protein RUM44_008919 [Polyplax serrata]|uniref:Uncharacterized protein n=1 Tax=Polyplax serrata TaxID=468196 RepID=A0ABR1AR82_POLSC
MIHHLDSAMMAGSPLHQQFKDPILGPSAVENRNRPKPTFRPLVLDRPFAARKMSKVKENVIAITAFLCLALFHIIDAVIHFILPTKFRVKSIAGDVVLVTGGGGGLGRLLSERLAKLGCTVVIWDINQEGRQISSCRD